MNAERRSDLTHSGKKVRTTPEQRCGCGQLLALAVSNGVEIKCKRCKRFHVISWQELSIFLKDKGPLSPDPTGQENSTLKQIEQLGSPCLFIKEDQQ